MNNQDIQNVFFFKNTNKNINNDSNNYLKDKIQWNMLKNIQILEQQKLVAKYLFFQNIKK